MTIYATNTVTFQDWDGLNLVFTYNPTARTLTRIKNGQSTILLQGCDQFSFTMLQRNIIEGEYDYYLADDVYTCKVVRVKWSCSRDLLGRKAQITDGQSADVVIRKQ
jgi:hypothetical protein